MTVGKKPDAARLDKILADARRAADQRDLGYRERSLKMYPWVLGAACANLRTPMCPNLQCTIVTTITTTIRLMAATGNCCVFIAMITSTRVILRLTGDLV